MALQLGFPDGSPVPSLKREWVKASLPLLMWLKEMLERRALEARLAETEGRFHADMSSAIQIQEDEREWLGLEVHDRVAQTLVAVFQQLQTVESLSRSVPEIRQAAVRGSLLCKEAIHEARNIMNDLRPPILEDLGLIPVVQEELRHLQQDVGCRARAKLVGDGRLPWDLELALYRVLHEALLNIRRHANASEVTVSLEWDQDEVHLKVEDNGAGFDVGDALAKKRVGGLVSMRRRAEIAGGTCHFKSKPAKGATVSVHIPLAGR